MRAAIPFALHLAATLDCASYFPAAQAVLKIGIREQRRRQRRRQRRGEYAGEELAQGHAAEQYSE